MKSTIRDLYRGRIIPWERRASHNREQLETFHKLEDEERYFMQKLSAEDYQRFQAFMSLHTQMMSIEEEDVFSYGFSLGVLLLTDVAKEAEVMVNE